MSINKEYDFIVIGGGSAGYAAARTAVDHGLSTAVIDGAETLGGLCILRGCMPSKTLIESADRFRGILEADEFGLHVENPIANPAEIIARKRRLIGEFAEYRQGQLEEGRFALIRGTARFISPNQLQVTPRADGEENYEIHFRTACIATGSVVTRMDLPGLEATGYLTSNEVLELENPPESVVVLGGGAIALEMACYFEGIGKKVRVVQRSPHLLSGTDHDIADALADAMRERGIELFTGTALRSFETDNEGRKVVHFDHNGEATQVAGAELILALGRQPNTAGLDLEAAGIEFNQRQISANAEMATSTPHIFAAGDVCGPHEVVHTAIEQGETAAHNAAQLLASTPAPAKTMDYRLKLYGIFTHPGVGTVGMSELEASEQGRSVEVATYPFDDHGKSMVKGEVAGFVKMIADASSGELLGAAVIGPEAIELIHELVVALHFRCTAAEFLRIPHYHPTLSEIWTYPADDIAEAVAERENTVPEANGD
jgi:pyruvate/2-oxoglutarate dehydrogenase complex dihydrolipoamide dehydrogenase (E3) component